MRYSLDQLIQRANAGNIGRRGLQRLQGAGLDPNVLAASGAASPLHSSPEEDLAARRAALYATAVQTAHDAGGAPLSAGIQRRLQLGAGGPQSQNTLAPHSGAEVQAFQGDNYNSILDSLKRRAQGIGSSAGIYSGWRG